MSLIQKKKGKDWADRLQIRLRAQGHAINQARNAQWVKNLVGGIDGEDGLPERKLGDEAPFATASSRSAEVTRPTHDEDCYYIGFDAEFKQAWRAHLSAPSHK